MGERKGVNKYYSSDFDPAKIPRRRPPKNRQTEVRGMLPIKIRCQTCGSYNDRGTKFNMRKEDVVGEKYLGRIQITRLYFNCNNCSAEIIYKTDPKNSHYVIESGGRAVHEHNAESAEQKRDAEEFMGDALKSLENRTLASKREMDRVVALDELMSMKSRQAAVTADALLEATLQGAKNEEKEMKNYYEDLAKLVSREMYVWRIADDDYDDEEDDLAYFRVPVASERASNSVSKRRKLLDEVRQGNPTFTLPSNGKSILKKKSSLVIISTPMKTSKEEETKQKAEHNFQTVRSKAAALRSLCQQYESDEDDD